MWHFWTTDDVRFFWIWITRSLLNATKFDSSDSPSHFHAMEQAVKVTTEASQTVYGFEARHIITKVLSQKLRTAFLSKGFYVEQFDYILSSIKIVFVFSLFFGLLYFHL